MPDDDLKPVPGGERDENADSKPDNMEDIQAVDEKAMQEEDGSGLSEIREVWDGKDLPDNYERPEKSITKKNSFIRGLWTDLKPALSGMDAGSFIIPIVACISLLLARYHGGRGAFRRIVGDRIADWPLVEIHPHMYWFLASFVFYGLFPLIIVALMPREKIKDYGLGLGDWRLGIKITVLFFVIMIPLLFFVSRLSDFSSTYPLSRGALFSWQHFFVYQSGYAMYFIGWEFLFRGFLLFGLYKRIGNQAIWVQLIPFVMLHGGKPELEAYASIIAGIALAVVALRTRSFWYCAVIHAAVATTMDIISSWGRVGAGS